MQKISWLDILQVADWIRVERSKPLAWALKVFSPGWALKARGLSAQGAWWQIVGLAWFNSVWFGLGYFGCCLVNLVKFKSNSQVPGNHDWPVSSLEKLGRISGSKLGCLQLPLLDETQCHCFGMSDIQDKDSPTRPSWYISSCKEKH